MAEKLEFSLLGPVRGWRDGRELDLGSPQQRSLLAVLLLAEGRAVGLAQLVDALWGDDPPTSAIGTVRTYVSRLRAVIGGDRLTSLGNGYSAYGELDVTRFADLAARAERTSDAAVALRLLREALDLWQGEPLSGLPGTYVDAQRVRLAELRFSIQERRVSIDLAAGRHREVIGELSTMCAEHPLRERPRALLMLALARAGRQVEALDVYADARRLLAEELGVDPGPELAATHAKVLAADASLAWPSPSAPRARTGTAPRQLPADIADFTGRAVQQERLVRALRSGGLATVGGVGGVGKTALAVHVAHAVAREFPDGQLYADLHGATDVLAGFLRALGVDPGEPGERAALFRATVAERRLLVLLDNATDADQVRALLPGSVGCAVLVTARERLTGLRADVHVELDGLSPGEAFALFSRIVGESRTAAERSAAADTVAACDHLPLAVRVAASRLAARPAWTVAHLRDRLADERRRREPLVLH
ncbi:BTAD domain-containing putative transcriptional regulator [Nonomuraea sp. NPDC050556]|uniref:AfsR/SARP family transcriptional regulator n=1 Tax=Nonomuraea sp. NPDC050556 TaxID=3364369 RepID=UPI0037BDC876